MPRGPHSRPIRLPGADVHPRAVKPEWGARKKLYILSMWTVRGDETYIAYTRSFEWLDENLDRFGLANPHIRLFLA